MVRMHQDDASDDANRPLGIETKVEVDVWRLRYAMVRRPDCT